MGIVVLTNSDQNNSYENVTNQIRNAFLEISFENYSDKSLVTYQEEQAHKKMKIEEFKSIVKEKNPTSASLDAFTGVYNNKLYGTIEIKKENEKLKIYFSNHIGLTADLEHMKDDRFLCSYSNPIFGVVDVSFKLRGEDVMGVGLKVADYIEGSEYEFEKRN